MTAVIRSVDPNHMVDLGSISFCGSQGNDVRYVNAGGVDLCDAYHDYAKGTEALPSWAASHLSLVPRRRQAELRRGGGNLRLRLLRRQLRHAHDDHDLGEPGGRLQSQE